MKRWVWFFTFMMAAGLIAFLLVKPIESSEKAGSKKHASLHRSIHYKKVVLSENKLDLDGKTTLFLQMSKGIYLKTPSGGKWEGSFQLIISDSEGHLVHSFDLNPSFHKDVLKFDKKFPILFADYNGDGNQDFSIGQQDADNRFVYTLFTVVNHRIQPLSVQVSKLYSNQRNYSALFQKTNDHAFKTVFYDPEQKCDFQQQLGWKDGAFVLLDQGPLASTTQPQKQDKLFLYNGRVEHIFFHPLIAYPELAFDHDNISKGYNDWFVTVSEFNKILKSLYEKQFILIDIRALYEQKTVNGRTIIQRKQLFLPENKKPLIISIDDLNYYDYMIQNGNVHKLILDAQGNVGTYSVTPQEETKIAYDNEIVPILDRFVQDHPDFSFQGAKGIIALTGFEGVLGYRTQKLHDPDYKAARDEALKLVARLKETGWSFACHGYGHSDANRVSAAVFAKDTAQWKQEVESIVGSTPIYIYPYGSRVSTGSEKYKILLKAGFYVLCSVGPTSYIEYRPEAFMMDRRHIDGISLETQQRRLADLFDSRQIIDPVRFE